MASTLCPSCGAVSAGLATRCDACGTELGIDLRPTRVAARAADPLTGVRLGDYVVEQRIGSGGMGLVYRAMHPLVGNAVAIKVLRPDIISSESDLQRFLGEAKAVNQVRHPGVVSIFGAGDTPDGRKYLVMELLQGESLEARLQREGKLSPAEAVPILRETVGALSAVHAAGVVHRDLKPANVFLAAQSDGTPYVKLLDFGLARRSNNLEVSRVAGTPEYISPEHSKGRPPGPAADFYSLGVMAFHLLTGRLPFKGTTAVELMQQHVLAVPPNATSVEPNIPEVLSELIDRLLAKDPLHRPIAAAVLVQLDAVAVELRSARTQLTLPEVREPASAPVPAARGGGDTEPQLPARSGDSVTPMAAPTPLASMPQVGSTAADLPRRRWPRYAIAGGLLVMVAIAADALLSLREVHEPPVFEGRRAMPELAELPPEADELPPIPEAAPAPVPVAEAQNAPAARVREPKRPANKRSLKQRLERAQRLAHERRAEAIEGAAKGYLQRLDRASRDELADLERQTARLEDGLAELK